MKILCLIPARGGSKGIPDKNIVDLHGKPLIQYTIDIAKRIKLFNSIVVSTDSPKIMKVAQGLGVTVLKRPKALASDSAPMDMVLEHALENIDGDFEWLVLLQPTSPLRTVETTMQALRMFEHNISDYDSLIPLTPIESKIGSIQENEYSPKFGLGRNRQDMPKMYQECGTIFIHKTSWIKCHRPYGNHIYPYVIESKREALDIDTLEDLRLAEYYLGARE